MILLSSYFYISITLIAFICYFIFKNDVNKLRFIRGLSIVFNVRYVIYFIVYGDKLSILTNVIILGIWLYLASTKRNYKIDIEDEKIRTLEHYLENLSYYIADNDGSEDMITQYRLSKAIKLRDAILVIMEEPIELLDIKAADKLIFDCSKFISII